MQKTTPYTTASIYYLRIHLTKEVQNYKPLLKETKEELNKQKDIPGSWIQRPNIVQMATHSKLISLYNQFNPYQTVWNAQRQTNGEEGKRRKGWTDKEATLEITEQKTARNLRTGNQYS